jgi:hypothetical protein
MTIILDSLLQAETATTANAQVLVFIDAGIEDYNLLVEGILPTAEAIALHPQEDGITQISEILKNRAVSSIQLIAHGSSGSLKLGSTTLNLENIPSYSQQLQQWQTTDILIYGCEVAAGERGQGFLQQLHHITKANIAASPHKIGQGNWELETKIGSPSSTLAITESVQATYPGLLVSFSEVKNFIADIKPFSVVAGDFNGDGKQDLAVANSGSNNISILLGDRTGNFSSPSNFIAGITPSAIAKGDFNEDGILDLIVTNFNSNSITLLLGDGTGSFNLPTTFTLLGGNIDPSVAPSSLAIADLNKDGNLDVVVANYVSGDVSVLLGDGTGLFSPPNAFFVGDLPASVTLADLDGDGNLDIVTANSESNDVSILLGDGTGNFGDEIFFDVETGPNSVVAGDFNNDGLLDLATANSESDNVSVLIAEGTGFVKKNFHVGTSPTLIVTGDFNGDGNLDLATTNFDSNNVSVLTGDGAGNFADAANFAIGNGANSLTVGDFNDDGKPDLATANGDSNNVSVLLNNSVFPVQVRNTSNDVFNIRGGSDKAAVKISLTGNNSNQVSEFGLFIVDDQHGNINGIAPDAAGYAEAALERAQIIFSAINNVPNGFSLENFCRILAFNPNTYVRFYLIPGSSLDALESQLIDIGNVLFPSISNLQINQLENGGFSLSWDDNSDQNIDFQDITINIEPTDQTSPLGTGLQTQSEGEVIDLRNTSGELNAEFTFSREASYNNFGGFYRVLNAQGGIDTNNDGQVDLLPGQAGYIQAAVGSRLADINLTVNNQDSRTLSTTLQGGFIYVPFIVVNSQPEALFDNDLNNDPAVFFPFLGANADGIDHVRMLGDNIFAFEDMMNGGDEDFNDLIVQVNFTTTA